MSEPLDILHDDHEALLSRLDSSKALYVVTGNEVDDDAVRIVAATKAVTAADLFDQWADSEPDDEAAALFLGPADTVREHAETVGVESNGSKPNVYDVLAESETADDRLGGAFARAFMSLKVVKRMIGFFIGDADPMIASDFRALKPDLSDRLDMLETAASDLVDGGTVAHEVADMMVETTYDKHVETLRGMDVELKNICQTPFSLTEDRRWRPIWSRPSP